MKSEFVVATPELPDAKHLKNTVEKLASYPTRNSLSAHIKPACEWLADQLRPLPKMQVEVMEYTLPKGRRVPNDIPCYQVVATLPGKSDRRIIIGGHIDSLNLEVKPEEGPAPGANDDASGVAVVAELARILSATEHEQTLVFVAFSGEEQGLLGSTALAKRATDENWTIDAVLNNDTVGSSENLAGQKDNKRIRIFSEESENHQSRELARISEFFIRQTMQDFRAKLVFRRDRFGRGGDHTPFANAGFNAVRFIEVHEEYTHQHTPNDLVENMDFEYLAQVAQANLAVMATLAQAGPQPKNVRMVRADHHATRLTWDALPGQKYVVYHRETTSPVWEKAIPVGEAKTHTVDLVNVDDHIFAVGAEFGIPVEAV